MRARAASLALLLAACASGAGTSPRSDGSVRSDGPLACGALLECDGTCVDTDVDALNCGGCGQSCVVPHASAACAMGECAVGECEAGRVDCNGMVDDGCEQLAACEPGGACATSCGTTGTLDCADVCAPVCRAPADVCNAIDDDCDGTCDQGALPGCRRPVHRSNGPNGHFYTISAEEAACCGMTVEALGFFHVYVADPGGLSSLFRCIDGTGHHFYTTSTSCDDAGALEGSLGFVARDPRCGAVALHRLRHASGDHFYTVSDAERDYAVTLGYAYVGIAAYVWLAP